MNQRITRSAPYLWLVYLGALVFQPAFDPDTTAADWVATAAMVVVFLLAQRHFIEGIKLGAVKG